MIMIKENKMENAALDGAKIAFITKCLENTPQQADFRYVKWGASKNQIKRTEAGTGPIWYEDENVISYETTFDTRSAIVSFFFDNDRLTEGVYGLQGTSDDYATYSKSEAIFSSLFGTPIATRELWTDESLKESLDQNTAIQLGKLQFFAMWETPRSRIGVSCVEKEEKGVIHSIHYRSAIIANN
jgi:hypothetical protein